MKRYIWIVCAILSFLFTAPAVYAGDFDGSKPLLLSVVRAIECTPDGSCQEVAPDNVGLPRFLKIDFTNKTILPASASDNMPASTIERHEVVDGDAPGTR